MEKDILDNERGALGAITTGDRRRTDAEPERMSDAYNVGRLYHLLTVALPYVEKVAATQPTEWARQQRQRHAVLEAKLIREALADIERSNPGLKAAQDNRDTGNRVTASNINPGE